MALDFVFLLYGKSLSLEHAECLTQPLGAFESRTVTTRYVNKNQCDISVSFPG